MMTVMLAVMAPSMALSMAAQSQEQQAVTRLQQWPVAAFDGSLPRIPLQSWLKQVLGAEAGLGWQVTDCGEPPDRMGDAPICVEATAMLPDERTVILVFPVGSQRKGLSAGWSQVWGALEYRGSIKNLPRLSALPEMLRRPLGWFRRRPVALPDMVPPRAVTPMPGNPRVLAALRPMGASFTLARRETPPVAVPAPPETNRLSEKVLLGNATYQVRPAYPPMAKQIRLTGEVSVEIIISSEGRVLNARAISGPPMLRLAAEDAALKWRFKPTTQNGKPMPTLGVIRFIFSLP